MLARRDAPTMNYRHAFHAGNHADVLKHVVLLAACQALTRKPTACFALDTHAGRGLYLLDGEAAQRTGEAAGGIGRLAAADCSAAALQRYLAALAACRARHGETAYPGSPWLLAHALRAEDRIACCELHPEEAAALRACCANDPRIGVHERDGYAAIPALLPPKVGQSRFARGLVLVDPPFEAQLDEFAQALPALARGLERWPQGVFLFWYPIKQRRALNRFDGQAARLPGKSLLQVELMIRGDVSPLRMNGSGLLVVNAPFGLAEELAPALLQLQRALREDDAGSHRLRWLRTPE
jgi:23S rRNA (adenine2030-N6)-methyltransferase